MSYSDNQFHLCAPGCAVCAQLNAEVARLRDENAELRSEMQGVGFGSTLLNLREAAAEVARLTEERDARYSQEYVNLKIADAARLRAEVARLRGEVAAAESSARYMQGQYDAAVQECRRQEGQRMDAEQREGEAYRWAESILLDAVKQAGKIWGVVGVDGFYRRVAADIAAGPPPAIAAGPARPAPETGER